MIIEHETPAQTALREARQRSDETYWWLSGTAIGGIVEAATLPNFVTGSENAGLFLLSIASLTVVAATISRKEYLFSRVHYFEDLVSRDKTTNYLTNPQSR